MSKLFQFNGRSWVEIGRNGIDGKTPVAGLDFQIPDETKIISEVIKKIPLPKDGVDGKSSDPDFVAEIVLAKIPKPKDGKDAVFTGEEAVKKINALEIKPELQIDASHIKGLRQIVGSARKGGGGSTMRVDNLSSQADGVTTTFTTTYRIGTSHLLFYSSFPTLFLPTTDYTVSGKTVTLAAGVPIPQAGQSLAIIYEDGS